MEVLESITPLSKTMEVEPLNIKALVAEVQGKLNQLLQSEGLQEELSECENLSLYQGDQDGIINVSYLKGSHRARCNRDRDTNLRIEANPNVIESVIQEKKSLKNILGEKFVNFDNAFYNAMRWIDPQNWDNGNKIYLIYTESMLSPN